MARNEETHEDTYVFVHETDDAILIKIDDESSEKEWWPKSTLTSFEIDRKKMQVTVVMPEWLAIKRGLV